MTSRAVTAKNIAKQLKAETGRSLELVKGEGYWYFTYEECDGEGKCTRFDTHSVYTMYLGSLSFDQWMDEGRAFVSHLINEDRLYRAD